MIRKQIGGLAFALALVTSAAQAAPIVSTIGNDAPGAFSDGGSPTLVTFTGEQVGPAPFVGIDGSDGGLFGDIFASFDYAHAYAVITDPILSASITVGIWDHDSAAAGDQLDLFTVDGVDFTATLNAAFEAGGGATNQQYREYTIALPGSSFAGLLDGSVAVDLDLKGPGRLAVLFPVPGVIDSTGNEAGLLFSRLNITTQDPPTGGDVPEPSSFVIFGLFSLLGLARMRRKKK